MARISGFFAVFFVFILISSAFGYEWQFDKDHSEIRFQVKHILTTVSGSFGEFEGDVEFDPEMPEKGKFNFSVTVKSVDTENGKRDNHLKSKDFFEVDKFPEMTFKSTSISKKMNNMFQVAGVMTIKDVSKNMTIDLEFLDPVTHPFNKKKLAGFISKFDIRRLDFGVGNGKFLKMGVVGEIVNVVLEGEAFAD
ncbi:MAG: polyisoprenoid-binding protein [Deltaproteobacteria bacterium]|jgi:polyisoprenoid-binding protein YceI|nr:polyisoprenoid-binding protein [Deltaproteobacteria bacterium]